MNATSSSKSGFSAFGIGLLTIVPTTIAWIVNLRAGPRLDGFTGGPMVLAIPFLLFLYSIAWLVIREVLPRFFRLTFVSTLIVSALSMYLAVSILCGPIACFSASNSNRRLGLFLVVGAVLFAGVHHLILSNRARQDV